MDQLDRSRDLPGNDLRDETQMLCDALRSTVAGPDPDDPRQLVDILVQHGILGRFTASTTRGGYRYSTDWRKVFNILVALGGVDLSLARLFEGHLNALQLVSLYGTTDQKARVLVALESGGMLGVWGADSETPVRLNRNGEGRWILGGAKRYASGAGLLRSALVPINDPDGGPMQLLLLDVGDPARVDLSSWNMRGMRRSISGTYDFSGIEVTDDDFVGAPDDYRREPHFVGGIWRCAAAQLGAIEAIVREMAHELAGSGRDGHPLQMSRIGKAIIASRTARLWIEDAAARVEGGTDASTVANSVALSAYGRLVTEEAAMAVIDLAERALGLASFANAHPVEALIRDLAVYIRQANPDAVLLQHGRVLADGLRP